MASPVRRSLALALVGLAAGLGLVAALVWGWQASNRGTGRPGAEPPTASAPAPDGSARTLAGPGMETGKPDLGRSTAGESTPGTMSGDSQAAGQDRRAAASRPGPEGSGSEATPAAPSFDIVRVEPNGEAVVAGRGAPNTVVEMLVDGKPVAKALADPSGQFAIVPPALPAGSSAIQLRSKTADGRETRSKQSVAVAVSERRDRKPLVALTAPDTPTVVLSQPGPPQPAGDAEANTKTADSKAVAIKPGAGLNAGGKGQVARIVSVDAQENGRLFVTGAGAPGATLRLYLNDTLIAPGSIGPDGTVTFTIGRGVKPGRYQVRIDQIEPGTGKVRSRAEVPFSVPEPVRGTANVAAREPAAPSGTQARTDAPEPSSAAQGRSGAEGGSPAGPGDAASGRGSAAKEGAGKAAAGKTAPETAAPRTAATAPASPGAARPAPARRAEAGPATAAAVFVPEISTAKISRGDNLWRISQRTYGRGERYTVIFDANQDQIRDPDLIYPGQIFVLPTEKRG